MELREENAELKREKSLITATARATESEIQRKLGEIIGPIKTSIQQAFNHALGLTDNLTNSLDMLESLQQQNNRSRSRISEELASSWFQKSVQQNTSKQTPQATVSPRVNGYEILKPKIRISRLNMEDINLEHRQQSPQQQVRPQPRRADPGNEAPEQDSNIDTTADEESNSERMYRSRRRRGRSEASRAQNPSSLEALQENSEEENESREEMVLLVPRIVLDKVRVTPTRPSSACSRRPSEDIAHSSPSPTSNPLPPGKRLF